ncbi:MAG: tripartite tricarboxylate transporter TctB family protein [Lachnospiraceae bacterium]|nr:tripartite tricarboxylate transporter TctB family protein [Lachnospiraceae bacterium]
MSDLMNRVDSWLDEIGARLEKKELTIPVNLVGGILFLIFAVFILAITPSQVTISEKDVVNGRAFPSLLMGVIIFCCVLLIGKEVLLLVKKQPMSTKTLNLLVEVKALLIFLILLVTYLICRYSGLFVAGAIFCSLAFLIFFRCKKPSYYAITLAFSVGIWAAFRFLLNVRF